MLKSTVSSFGTKKKNIPLYVTCEARRCAITAAEKKNKQTQSLKTHLEEPRGEGEPFAAHAANANINEFCLRLCLAEATVELSLDSPQEKRKRDVAAKPAASASATAAPASSLSAAAGSTKPQPAALEEVIPCPVALQSNMSLLHFMMTIKKKNS